MKQPSRILKRVFVFLTFILLCFAAWSHEFWLQPDRYIFKPGDVANVRFWVGENFEGENWGGNNSRVNFLQHITDHAAEDLKTALSNKAGDSVQVKLTIPGTSMVVFNSNNTLIKLEAQKFNGYLVEDGLLNAIDYRKQKGETDSVGKEFYQRSVKVLLQCGKKNTSIIHRSTQLPLDVIPLLNPFMIRQQTDLWFLIHFKGKPLQDQAVKVWHRLNGKTTMHTYQTNEKGMVNFPASPSGKWLVSTVYMERMPAGEKADWQSYWGSCGFGYY